MQLHRLADGFDLVLAGQVVLAHRSAAPAVFVGRGDERMDMYRGNFDIEDYVSARLPLAEAQVRETAEGWRIALGAGDDAVLTLVVARDAATIGFETADPTFNRFWLRIAAEAGERVWGGGEQMSYLDLRGRRFPMWTSEPGVGRDKSTWVTFESDRHNRAGGDYYTTNYPQPTFLSSRRHVVHVETTAYSVLDFRNPAFHEIEVWALPDRIEFFARDTLADLVTVLSERFGRQPQLPDWALDGAIIGLKDGLHGFERLERYIEAGAAVSAIWCEDWVGLRHTTFGARLFWNWQASPERYPDLKQRIADLRERGIRFLGYANPYLCVDGPLFAEAERLGHLATNNDGETYHVDFGEFDCGVVDFTSPDATRWFEDRILAKEMLDIGMAGWMADFGEYLPIDVKLKSGVAAKTMHNAWPVLWAEANARVIERRGLTGEALFFMRAGYTGVQKHCPLLWAGDQSVDFSRHDGLVTVIVGALSSGLVGNAYHHSDIGGYTSLFANVRTPELMMRWAEMAAFTPVMRTHEGNRPGENVQVDQNSDVLAHFARMTQVHAALKPYLRGLCGEAETTGLPLQRPLFLHHEDDAAAFDVWDAYLLGRDLLIAPVWHAGEGTRAVHLPAGADWVHLWTGERFGGGRTVEVAAPVGSPAVWYRADAAMARLFAGIAGSVSTPDPR